VLASVLNELNAISNDVVLVLDDYHLIDAQDIHTGMVFLLDHLPPHMHLVIGSRADPPLPLARLRARGELVEVRAADLRFTPDEAAVYLTEVMGLHLTAGDVAALEGRTEGWIAALQLAGLSMQGRADIAGFIAGFAGDDRYIVDYLVEEVLQRQTGAIRRFLLQTSILDRLSGPLCDAVTGQNGGKATLDALDRANLFVVPLDDRRRWYRYHHLFADVLRAHLVAEQPDALRDLHRRASDWYEQNGERSDAIRHALAAEDFPKAADLIEQAMPDLRRRRQEARLLGWLAALPNDLLSVRPVLSACFGGALLSTGQLQGVEARLRAAERWLDPLREPGSSLREPQDTTTDTADTRDQPPALSAAMVVVNQDEFRRLPGSIAVWRAGLALVLGDLPNTRKYAQRALDLVPEDDLLERGGAAGLLGLAAWASGDLESAHRTYAAGMADVLRAGHISDAITGAITQADIRIAQGRLHDAMRIYEHAMQLATAQGEPPPRGTADLYVGMSELEREHGNLLTATQHLSTSTELGERSGFPPNGTRWSMAMAGIRDAQGDPDGALNLLDEAERLYVSDFSPNVRPVAALKARVWVAHGRVSEAVAWARERGLSAEDDLGYLREFEHITLARMLFVQRSGAEKALALLRRLFEAAEAGGRMGSMIEILVLRALAEQVRGDMAAALVALERTLTLAETEGYVRIFVDAGPPMAGLLEAAAKRGIATDYARQLLTAFGNAEVTAPVKQDSKKIQIEPLSARELEVLRLLGTDLDGPEIARELTVSLNTIRTHTKNLYSKLGVNNRRAAVTRAEELQLLSRTHKH
jgi:LuxR family maltose regulon positive regulatory protein